MRASGRAVPRGALSLPSPAPIIRPSVRVHWPSPAPNDAWSECASNAARMQIKCYSDAPKR